MMWMAGGLRLVLASLMATLVVAGGLASGAEAAPTQPDGGGNEVGIVVAPDPAAGDVSTEMLAAMQRDLKVTAAQARARLVRADWAARLDKPLRQRLGSAFGGSWLAEDGQEFVVAFTDRRLEGLVRASGATPKLVARSEAELAALGAKLAARAKEARNLPDALAGWVIDPQTNRVRMEHLPGGLAQAQAFAAAAGLTAGEVDYQVVPARPAKEHDVKGGEKYFPTPGGFPVGLDPSYCSTGFAVSVGTTPGFSRPGHLTAGHCAALGPETYTGNPTSSVPVHVHQGRFLRFLDNSIDDEAVVVTDPGFTPLPIVNGHGRGDIRVSDGTPQPDGSPVCNSGATTGLQCATIRSGIYNPVFPGGQMFALKATNTCSLPGDSGAPVISGTHAQGILVGGNGCPWFLKYTYYVPILQVLSKMGAVLRTTPVPTTPPPPGAPSPKWTTANKLWSGLGGAVQGKVASVSLSPDHLQVFGRGTDNRIWTNTANNGMFGGWQSLGAADALTGPPTVLARAGGIDVYYRGVDTRPYFRRFNGTSWEAPVKLGEIDVEGTITAVNAQLGHVILFIRSSDDEVYYNFTDGVAPWSGWLGLGGNVNASPTAIARTNSAGQIVLEVYARWADDNVRYRRLDPAGPSGWQPWVNLGGLFKDTPVGVTVGPNQSWLIGWSRDDTAHVQRWKDGDWLRGPDGNTSSGWRGLGGNLASPPTAVAGPGTQIRVFARDVNQRVNMIAWPGTNDIFWETWVPLEGDTGVSVGASLRIADQVATIDAFGIDVATQQPFHTEVEVASAPARVGINVPAPRVGDTGFYTINGPPGAPVSWSSTHNGVPVENHASYGHVLDGNGRLELDAGVWPGSALGSWVKQVHVGSQVQQTAQVAFTVSPPRVTVQLDKEQYLVGENVTYAVTGPPNRPIYWTSWVNGIQSGENHAFYGQYTNADGVFTVTAPWTDQRIGTWTKQVYMDDGSNGEIAQITFGIIGPPWPVTVRTDQTSYGFGDFITYAVTGPPNQAISWTSWVNGVLEQNNVLNGSTDANGGFTMSVPWIDVRNGTHVVQVNIGGQTAQTTFVFDWPQPPPPPLLPGAMTAAGTGKCLEIEGASVADGARAQQYACHLGANQQWRQSAVGGLIAQHSNKCLQPVGSAQGAVVQQVTCNALEPLQAWEVTAVTGVPYLFRVVSVSTGLCLSVQDGSLADGASIYLWPCDARGVGQRWADPDPPPPPPGLPDWPF